MRLHAALAWRLSFPLLVFLITGTVAVAGHKTQTVQVHLPVEPKLDTTGFRRVLVGGFLAGDYDRFNLHREIVTLLRRGLNRHTDLLILQDPPANLPEQRLEDLKHNAPFFQAVAENHRADLIISGRIQYGSADRSGFVQQEYISPTTGRRSLRTQYVERTGFSLQLDLIALRGSDGELIYEVSFHQDDIFSGDDVDPLHVFFELSQGFQEGFLSIFTPRDRIETRFLFTE